jgi:hypothetical protein
MNECIVHSEELIIENYDDKEIQQGFLAWRPFHQLSKKSMPLLKSYMRSDKTTHNGLHHLPVEIQY